MIDPTIFSFDLFGITFALRWYGVLIMTAVLVGTWIASREIRYRKGDPEFLWDALFWVLLAGIIGARLWYVGQSIVSGNRYFLDNPIQIINIPTGGLHFFGALLLGGLAAYLYARKSQVDLWMILDAVAPALLVGQALARPANFINQELYGQPTTLPWGLAIDAQHRIAPYNDLLRFPESTRFHPTFAYEMVWNLLAAGLLLWVSRRYQKQLKPGMVFAGWMVLAGIGRFIIEFFRPDQPRIPGMPFTYSAVVSLLMALVGGLWLLARAGKLKLPLLSQGPEKYQEARPEKTANAAQAKGARTTKNGPGTSG